MRVFTSKKTGKYMGVLALLLSLYMLAACGKQEEVTDTGATDKQEESAALQEIVDLLAVNWTVPGQGTDWENLRMQDEWEVVQCVSGLVNPTNAEYFHFQNDMAVLGGDLYLLLYMEDLGDAHRASRYELKKIDLSSMGTETIWASIADADFADVFGNLYVSRLQESHPDSPAWINFMDTDGENLYFFLQAGRFGEEEPSHYRIGMTPDGAVFDVLDITEPYREASGSEGESIQPQLIKCGPDGSLYLACVPENAIYLYDKTGNRTATADVSGRITDLQCIGKNPDGVPIFACATEAGQMEFFVVSAGGKQVLCAGPFPHGIYSMDAHGNVRILNGSRLMTWNVSTGELSGMYDYTGLDAHLCKGIAENDAGDIITCFGEGTDERLYRLSRSEHPETKELVLLQQFLDEYTKNCAADYSRTHPGVTIRVEQMDANDDYSWNKLIVDFQNGEGPDLIWADWDHLERLHAAGLLSPLGDRIPKDVTDRVFTGVLSFGTMDDELYAIPGDANLKVIFVSDAAWSQNGWTMEELLEAYRKQKAENPDLRFAGFDWDLDGLQLFVHLYFPSIANSEFLDLESGTCNFRSEGFYDLLRFCRDNADRETGTDSSTHKEDMKREIAEGRVFCLPYEGSLIGYSKVRSYLDEGFHPVGWPSASRTSGLVSCYHATACSVASENADVAADFLAMLLSEEYQIKYGTNWVRRDVMEKQVKDASEIYLYGEDGPEHPEKPAFLHGGGRIELDGRADGTSYVDEYVALMDGGVPVSLEAEIMAILSEEIAPFFAGQKSEQEVAKVIQSRIQLMLSE